MQDLRFLPGVKGQNRNNNGMANSDSWAGVQGPEKDEASMEKQDGKTQIQSWGGGVRLGWRTREVGPGYRIRSVKPVFLHFVFLSGCKLMKSLHSIY